MKTVPVILYIDDNLAAAEDTEPVLRKYGFKVEYASNAQEALEAARRPRQEISAVILDLVLPPGDAFTCQECSEGRPIGVLLYPRLRYLLPSVPVVAISVDRSALSNFRRLYGGDHHLLIADSAAVPPRAIAEALGGEAHSTVRAAAATLPSHGSVAGLPPRSIIWEMARRSKWISAIIAVGIFFREAVVKYAEHSFLSWLHERGVIGATVAQIVQWTWRHALWVYSITVVSYLALIFTLAMLEHYRQSGGSQSSSARPWLTAEYATKARGGGADGVLISNSGGSALDCSISPIRIGLEFAKFEVIDQIGNGASRLSTVLWDSHEALEIEHALAKWSEFLNRDVVRRRFSITYSDTVGRRYRSDFELEHRASGGHGRGTTVKFHSQELVL